MADCIFCRVASGAAPSKKRLENDLVVAFDSIEPVAQHHILIVPKKHIEKFDDIKEEDKDVVFAMIKAAQELVEKLKIKKGYKLIFNAGKYQYVPHLHWHLLGGKMDSKNDIVGKT